MTRNTNVCFILGAPRSGTTLLMEVLASAPRTVACYENRDFIRDRHFQARQNDHLFATDVDTTDLHYYNEFLQQKLKSGNATILLEKDIRNILRVPFLNKVFPNAKFIHIIRDGRDVCKSIGIITGLKPESTMSGWWGTRIPGFRKLANSIPNNFVLGALQWKYCVLEAIASLGARNSSRVLEIRYEEFVEYPKRSGQMLRNFLNLPRTPEFDKKCLDVSDKVCWENRQLKSARSLTTATSRRVGAFREVLTKTELEVVECLVGDLLSKLGYSLLCRRLSSCELETRLKTIKIDIPIILDWIRGHSSVQSLP